MSPHNTTRYLIENNSTPFFSGDDIMPSSIVIIDDEDSFFEKSKCGEIESIPTSGETIKPQETIKNKVTIFNLA